MSADTLPAPEPVRTPEVEPFWEGAARGVLVLPRCEGCQQLIWYPRAWCASCASTQVRWVEVSGQGTIYSVTTVYRGGAPDYTGSLPYVLAYVELAEGPRMLTNIHTEDPGSVEVGQPVEVVFDPVGDTALPRFRVRGEGGSGG